MSATVRTATTAIVAVGLLAGCVVTHPWSTTTPAEPLAPGEISRLDAEGRDRAEAIGHLRLDLSDLCLTTDETGFELDSPTIEWFGTKDRLMNLELIGPHGTLTSDTHSIKIKMMQDDQIDMLEWFVSEDSPEASRARLQHDAKALGLTDDQLGMWDINVSRVQSGDTDARLQVIGMTVTPTGFVMDVQGQYVESTGNQVYIYAIYLDPTLYTPENLDSVRETGHRIPDTMETEWTC